MKEFETNIRLSTVFHEYPVYDEFMLEYRDKGITQIYHIHEQKNFGMTIARFSDNIPSLFSYGGIKDLLRESADNYVKKFPEELFLLYDMNSNPQQLWIAPVKGSLIIKTDGIPENAIVTYDRYGNVDIIKNPEELSKYNMPVFRILLKPDYKELRKKYGAMAHI
jgi:hypothetical protein